ncbi:MAG: hypothetical protein MUE33_06400 [Cytophagaceae bacterium]|jgi:hypothetical protein|nr:hypothetical protein [Cytophagaceae bacterium]
MSFRNEVKDILLHRPHTINEDFWLEVFRYQYQSTPVYQTYCQYLKRRPHNVTSILQIPYLPISLFKTQKVLVEGLIETKSFYSSGTTGSSRSTHYVVDTEWYTNRSLQLFQAAYGSIQEYVILAVLPSYQENPSSSLLFMLDGFIRSTKHPLSGYYPLDKEALSRVLPQLPSDKKVLLWGVTYACLDLAESGWKWDSAVNVTVLETGGMKGRRQEWTRTHVHHVLKEAWGIPSVHSEYGMTEMLSQLYSTGDGLLDVPKGVEVSIRELQDPLNIYEEEGKSGGINIMDAANIDSCVFIEVQDIGKKIGDKVEILGRTDTSDIRGCNLLYTG